MQSYKSMSTQQLKEEFSLLQTQYKEYQEKNLKLNMARGKPDSAQLNLSMPMLNCLSIEEIPFDEYGNDQRNYGLVDGIHEAKVLFSQIIDVPADNIIVGGNSSLNMMYDTIARAVTHGVCGGTPWCKQEKIKFLCPSPGYDRHFRISEFFGFELVTIPMLEDGPDMDMVQKYVETDSTVKGIWCIPKYSNPCGFTYSDSVVKRFSKLKPAAEDFRIFWDNAYAIHDFNIDDCDHLLSLYDECIKNGSEDMVYIFTSTSKISFPGSGVAAMGASAKNLKFAKEQILVQTIGPNKINQFRHVRFLKDKNGVIEHMKKHAAIITPKFEVVNNALNEKVKPLGLAKWHMPKGGYFISFNAWDGCAKRIVKLCKECGVSITDAGATFPYGKDPSDSNIRIAPTYAPLDELKIAMEIFSICVQIASIEKLLAM